MEKQIKSSRVSLEKIQILVFRSYIDTNENATLVCNELLKIEGISKATIDLEDWENILRLECHPDISSYKIEATIFSLGFECSELE